MQGEIRVMEFMEQQQNRHAWQARQARDAEWVALKEWWAAERSLERADSQIEFQRALAQRARTALLYQSELQSAWPKWRAVLAERAALRKKLHPRS